MHFASGIHVNLKFLAYTKYCCRFIKRTEINILKPRHTKKPSSLSHEITNDDFGTFLKNVQGSPTTCDVR